jgi:hypothetical protein
MRSAVVALVVAVAAFAFLYDALGNGSGQLSPAVTQYSPTGEEIVCHAVKNGWLPEGSLCVPDGTGWRVVVVGPVMPPCERAPAPEGARPETCQVLEEFPTGVGSNALITYRLDDGSEITVLVAAGGHQIVYDQG